ncbi:asparaginase [Cupriavidus sp. AU9028]|uniref:asparaginase n=1 Tax=Cupriavidus sp. AU9028 TaxID=2871157 RepID=UPI001C9875E5|nr:asparaginase [Cupriavidus sp. AU9028]MBY4898063.1 asparaginase [Cupriavidus sp. AU9028]
MSTLPRVIVLATGGTIAGSASSAASSARYQAATVPVSALLQAVPVLGAVARLEAEQVAQVDSKDMSFGLWKRLSARIDHWAAQPDVAGIVVTHGTDTLEETAMLLHLTLRVEVPVVLTAAMRPSTALSADGPANLLDAIRVAADPQAHGKGVLVVLNQEIHSARDAVKAHTASVGAFVSPSAGPLGFVQDATVRVLRAPLPGPAEPWAMPSSWPLVEIVASYAEPSRLMVDALVAGGARGIVVAAAGNGSVHDTLVAALVDAAEAGVAVVRSSRTGAGHVAVPPYINPAAAAFPTAGDLNPYKARVALGLLLGAEPDLAADAMALQQRLLAI